MNTDVVAVANRLGIPVEEAHDLVQAGLLAHDIRTGVVAPDADDPRRGAYARAVERGHITTPLPTAAD